MLVISERLYAHPVQCRKRNRICQELRNMTTRVMLPSHIYTTRCGSFFTWIRAHVTIPRYCRANIPIYIRLIYHFIARTTHCYCYITITTFLFSAVTFYVSHSVPWNLHYGPGLADFIVPLTLDRILNEQFIMTFISAQSKKNNNLTDVPFTPHTIRKIPISMPEEPGGGGDRK